MTFGPQSTPFNKMKQESGIFSKIPRLGSLNQKVVLEWNSSDSFGKPATNVLSIEVSKSTI